MRSHSLKHGCCTAKCSQFTTVLTLSSGIFRSQVTSDVTALVYACCLAAGLAAAAVVLLLMLISADMTLHRVDAQAIGFDFDSSGVYLDSPFPRIRPNITCELRIEGGSNATEISLYGTSIASAHINCTGGILIVTFHPVMARFASGFRGVALGLPEASGTASVQAMGRSAGVEGIPIKYGECIPMQSVVQVVSPILLTLCASYSHVTFVRARVVNITVGKCTSCDMSLPAGSWDVLQIAMGNSNMTGRVHFQEPHFVNVPMTVLATYALSQVTVVGGVFERTGGVQLQGLLSKRLGPTFWFLRTRFTSNAAIGAAVRIVLGHAEFHQCAFEGNTASILDGFDGPLELGGMGFGLGGAIYLSSMGGIFPKATSLLLVGCSFHNNTALAGGAVALVGGDATFTDCTFTNNRAARQGENIFAGVGAALRIEDSSIAVSSPTVQWDRDNASECFRGEYVGTIDRMCRRCPAATYSLEVAAINCSACPLNAQVRQPCCQQVSVGFCLGTFARHALHGQPPLLLLHTVQLLRPTTAAIHLNLLEPLESLR